ncbi:hypothetical protein DCAR_0103252 [Daucus carota subsp. sativus]|uniref:Uncharacterized protein n=1 Tax=Daucus carota subsp. sativus TaxID=79200 RepID=A0A162AKX7_DAUCS|nr:hypothetical protein DCAR_0103252 [Daucus carota subsp. sativus]
METYQRLYTFDRPVGGVEELLDWDQGMDQVDDLGLGQLNAPRFARSEMDIDEMEEMIEGAVEDSFVASFGPNDLKDPLWAYEPPLGDID